MPALQPRLTKQILVDLLISNFPRGVEFCAADLRRVVDSARYKSQRVFEHVHTMREEGIIEAKSRRPTSISRNAVTHYEITPKIFSYIPNRKEREKEIDWFANVAGKMAQDVILSLGEENEI